MRQITSHNAIMCVSKRHQKHIEDIAKRRAQKSASKRLLERLSENGLTRTMKADATKGDIMPTDGNCRSV